MKYIKPFYENVKRTLDREKIKFFCEESLIYLLDEGYKFTVLIENKYNLIFTFYGIERKIRIKNHFITDKVINWNDIKDEFMTFINRFDKEHNINRLEVSSTWFEIGSSGKIIDTLSATEEGFGADMIENFINDIATKVKHPNKDLIINRINIIFN